MNRKEMYDAELAEVRREGYSDGLAAGVTSASGVRDEGHRMQREARRLLWAAAMSNGGTLRISEVALDAYDRGDYVSQEAYDPRIGDMVIIARRSGGPTT